MNYLWCDFETTGLNPATSQIVEYAFHLTGSDGLRWDAHGFLKPSGVVTWEAEALAMHERSGLLGEWLAARKDPSTLTVDVLDDTVTTALLTRVPPHDVMLAGHGVHFDRRFVERWLPKLDKFLHYRIMDVSTLDTFFGDSCGVPRAAGVSAHRAAADIAVSMSRYAEFREAAQSRFAGWMPASSVKKA